jgi:(E)-4-hydroxy-3-methylbut-2-enyl-diphosphate synthase
MVYNLSMMDIKRRISKQIMVGDVAVGGGAPISVQSMTKTDTRDVAATVRQIKELEEMGCEIIRSAVIDLQAAEALGEIKKQIRIPLLADIQFDYRLALAALESGVDGLRLNPGNITEKDKVKAVVLAAKERHVPIRIGVNSGSLPKTDNPALTVPERMVEAALKEIRFLENLDFDLIKVSLKASDVLTTIAAYRAIADKMPYPLHVGITESGTPRTGITKSAVGIGTILYLGLGDTIRVSLTAPPHPEVFIGYEILKDLGLREGGLTFVSCPTCGRTNSAEVIKLAERVDKELMDSRKPIKVAVMGCEVNGPGEAKDADVGIACGKGRGAIFKNGIKVATVDEKDFYTALMKEVEGF